MNKIAVTVASDMAENFNPRPRKEGDINYNLFNWFKVISIHALAKRATQGVGKVSRARSISIHALAKRATRGARPGARSPQISIHALAKRATLRVCA